MEEHYKKNSIFYPFLNLLLDYVTKDKADVIYTITEISVRNQGNDTDQESAFFKKMLSTEDFYIIDAPYFQPYLGSNVEANFKCELLIKMPTPAKHITPATYINIVQEIYFSHYLVWYSRFMDAHEIARYNEHLSEQLKKIVEAISTSEIHLTSYKATECAYFETSRCAFSERSTAGNAPMVQPYSERIWLYIPLFAVLTFGLSIGIYYFLQKISVPSNTFAPIYATTATAIATIMAAIFAIKYKKS